MAQGEPWCELSGAPSPSYFGRRTMLPTDFCFLALVFVGVGFLLGGLLAVRRGRYPRTDGFGATLVGTILASLGAVVLFVRLWAVVHD